jgi:hypothetical protein
VNAPVNGVAAGGAYVPWLEGVGAVTVAAGAFKVTSAVPHWGHARIAVVTGWAQAWQKFAMVGAGCEVEAGAVSTAPDGTRLRPATHVRCTVPSSSDAARIAQPAFHFWLPAVRPRSTRLITRLVTRLWTILPARLLLTAVLAGAKTVEQARHEFRCHVEAPGARRGMALTDPAGVPATRASPVAERSLVHVCYLAPAVLSDIDRLAARRVGSPQAPDFGKRGGVRRYSSTTGNTLSPSRPRKRPA